MSRAVISVQTGSGATSAQVAAAESTLGLEFPDSYRRFLTEIGWASVYHDEIFGLGDDVPEHLEVVKLTQGERTEFRPHIPPHLVPVHNDGFGNHYCLDTGRSTGSECPIVFWDHEHGLAEDQIPEDEAAGFVDWLTALLRECRETDDA